MGGSRKARWLEILSNQVIPRDPSAGNTGRAVGRLLVALALVLVSALFASWVHIQSISVRYRISQAHRVQQRRVQIRDALEIERQMLRSPQRIAHIAEGELGMVLPGLAERVILR